MDHHARRIRRPALQATLGVAALAACAMAGPGAGQASGLSTLHSFTGAADGSTPYKGVTQDTAGNLYGTAFYGADACPDSYQYAGVGCGTVWKLDAGGQFTTLATFLGAKNGASPDSNLTLKGKVLYGAAYTGGAADQGTLFRLTTAGTGFRTLHAFNGADGQHPDTYPRIDSQGNIFSITAYGGPGYVAGQLNSGFGVLFEIASDGTFISEHPFSGGADGGNPGRIFLDASNTIFGATGVGGSCSGSGLPAAGCGVVYQFTPATAQFQVLYTFGGTADGYSPTLGGFDARGTLYGATTGGGAHGYGTLFALKPNGAGGYSYSHLYDFTGAADGAEPIAPAVEANGTLVGTTQIGPVVNSGNQGAGVLYQFAKGRLTPLYTFTNDANGGYPFGTPLVERSGTIVGVTTYGGVSPCTTSGGTLISSYGCGTVYQYVP